MQGHSDSPRLDLGARLLEARRARLVLVLPGPDPARGSQAARPGLDGEGPSACRLLHPEDGGAGARWRSSPTPAAAHSRARSRRGRRSRTPRPSGFATSSTTGSAGRRRSPTTAASSSTRSTRSSGRCALEAVTTERIDAYRARLVEEGKLSARTINKRLVILHGILRRAMRVYGLRSNPAALVDRQPQRRSGDFEVLDPAEVEALARAAESEQDAALFRVAAFTGLRLGELRALRWQDVDFAKRLVHVRRNFTHGAEGDRSRAGCGGCR